MSLGDYENLPPGESADRVKSEAGGWIPTRETLDQVPPITVRVHTVVEVEVPVAALRPLAQAISSLGSLVNLFTGKERG